MEFSANAAAQKQRISLVKILLASSVVLAFFFRFFLLVAIVTALIHTRLSRDPGAKIRIDDTGILCHKGSDTQWYFLWDEISSIQVSPKGKILLQAAEHSQMEEEAYEKVRNALTFDDCPQARLYLQTFAPEHLKLQ